MSGRGGTILERKSCTVGCAKTNHGGDFRGASSLALCPVTKLGGEKQQQRRKKIKKNLTSC